MKNEIRCAKCNYKLGEFEITSGRIAIICHRSKCKTMNIVNVKNGGAAKETTHKVKLVI